VDHRAEGASAAEPAVELAIGAWITRCLTPKDVDLVRAESLVFKSEREVWDCELEVDGERSSLILNLFHPGDLESVNTSLPPAQAARLCFLAQNELPARGIPTPAPLGMALHKGSAALATRKVEARQWGQKVRLEAARILARLHRLDPHRLSGELQELLRVSDPRMHRTTGGMAPPSSTRTLVHGDYFSKNILMAEDGLRVIDWETFGWGDPMWDLGFLIGADRDLSADAMESTLSAYAESAPIDRRALEWHRKRWSAFWEARVQVNLTH